MRGQYVHIEHDFDKPPERIFSYLAEHEHMAPLLGARITRLSDGSVSERNGVGSRRQLKVGPLPPFEETITEYEPPERISYQITKGSPLRGHAATMAFLPEGAGTRFVYDIRLASLIPGVAAIARVLLRRSILRALPLVERDA